LLDIGCSTGLITAEIADQTSVVVGIDIDENALRYAVATQPPVPSLHYLIGSGMSLPFGNACFSAVICNHVYEHVADPYALLREIARVLRPGGVCYFAAGHTLQVIEPHHRLPLLSWLPRGVANAWIRSTDRGERYEEKFLPPWRLRTLFADFGSAELVSPTMLREPQRYGFPAIAHLPAPIRRVIALLASPLARLAPTWIWLLRR
jgi:SAM-dependent methyltransferase